jgi:hypothetical protein
MTKTEEAHFYLLAIIGAEGRQILKDDLMERVADEPEAHLLLETINTYEQLTAPARRGGAS